MNEEINNSVNPTKEELSKSITELQNWIKEEKVKFKQKIKVLKPILKSQNYVLPTGWEELLASQYLENPEFTEKYKGKKITQIDFTTIPSISKKQIIEFVKNHTDELKELLQKEDIIRTTSKKNFPKASIRYQLILELFEVKKEFKEFSYEKMDLLISKILCVHEDTVRHIREKKPRYFTKNIDDRTAKELINKIKKGYYL
ncbi:hypothetical protein JYB62_11935 [Algoriphagus lutimaris]|uniref:hypothetical protein n=1 Tax=Algoriphagus lutimaris TaxID=613197 RepID=UPI00196B909C|nr:hypothetical protein [Algoriphagus lutimaris]MBN3520709.1 hypothetical protein [Algoriphagus lutimaris]